MDFDRFSRQEFDRLGLNSDAAAVLADELAAELLSELHDRVAEAASAIVRELRARGHALEDFSNRRSVGHAGAEGTTSGYQLRSILQLTFDVA